MQSFEASYFDGVSSKESIYTLQVHDYYIYVVQQDIKLYFDDIKISTKLRGIPQSITLKNGSYFMLNPNDSINQSYITKFESKYIYSFISLVVIFGIVAFFLTIGSSITAKYMANMLPQNILDNMSNQALSYIKEQYLEPSKLSLEEQDYIKSEFSKISPKGLNLKLHFYKSPILKANAFAFPSGDIVILDDIILLDKDSRHRGVLGVLAHEIGHVKRRHSMQNIIKTSIAGAIVGYFIGDFSSFVTALSTGLINLSYSREFENEADDEAIRIMQTHNISLKPLIEMFEELNKKSKMKNYPFLMSHPVFDKRIAKFNSALDKQYREH